jgi:hypothetical protein
MSGLNTYPVLAPQVVGRVVDDVMVILLPESGEVKVLNEIGGRIFQLADGMTSVADIAGQIAVEFLVSVEQAQADTLSFLQELQASQALSFKVAGELSSNGGQK